MGQSIGSAAADQAADGVDRLGRPLSGRDRRILALYRDVQTLLAERDVEPNVRANLKEAEAAIWLVAHGLFLVADRPPSA